MEISEVQLSAISAIIGGKTPCRPISEMEAEGHRPAVEDLIGLGLLEIWAEVERKDGKNLERWGGSVTLTPYGAWVVEHELTEFVESAPIWAQGQRDDEGRRTLIDRPIKAPRHPRLEFRDWRTLCAVTDPAPGPDYLADEEGHPVLYKGCRIPIDRRMGHKPPSKAKRRRKARRTS